MDSVALGTSNLCTNFMLQWERIQQYLLRNGWHLDPSRAEIGLFAGCAFNQHNEDKSLAALTEMARRRKLVICIEGLAGLVRVDNALRQKMPSNVVFLPRERLSELDRFFFRTVHYEDLPYSSDTRMVLVAEGCLSACSYCGEKPITGNLRSRGYADILNQIKHVTGGHPAEVTLIGEDVAAYGRDIRTSLLGLLERLLAETPHTYCLDKMNPVHLLRDRRLWEELLYASPKRIVRAVIGIQSGDDRVLTAMNRGYSAKEVRELARLWCSRTQVHLHIICGFPTESEEEWRRTEDLLCEAQPHSCVVFRYQDRSYAVASSLEPKIGTTEQDRRLRNLELRLCPLGYKIISSPDKRTFIR